MRYANGDTFRCGPPMRAGAYKKWNWCKLCTRIWEKKAYRCPDCNQMVRGSAKSSGRQRTRLERDSERIKVIQDLSGRHG